MILVGKSQGGSTFRPKLTLLVIYTDERYPSTSFLGFLSLHVPLLLPPPTFTPLIYSSSLYYPRATIGSSHWP